MTQPRPDAEQHMAMVRASVLARRERARPKPLNIVLLTHAGQPGRIYRDGSPVGTVESITWNVQVAPVHVDIPPHIPLAWTGSGTFTPSPGFQGVMWSFVTGDSRWSRVKRWAKRRTKRT